MTNKEILRSDLLDILFEHRNKSYGAYALRKTYTRRLGMALGISLSTVLFFILMSFINKNKQVNNFLNNDAVIKVTDVEMVKPKEPEPPRERPQERPPQA